MMDESMRMSLNIVIYACRHYEINCIVETILKSWRGTLMPALNCDQFLVEIQLRVYLVS